MGSVFNARLLRWLVLAGMLAVVGATVSSFLERTGQRTAVRSAPPRIDPQVSQQTHAFSLSKTLGDNTLYTVQADDVTHFKNKVVLHGVSIVLHGKQGQRRDRIESRQCEYDPSAGSLWMPGEVTMQLWVPPGGAAPGRGGPLPRGSLDFPRLRSGQAARDRRDSDSDASGDSAQVQNGPLAHARGSDNRGADSVTVVTSGLSFEQNSGIASTDQKVQFRFAQGEGVALGSVYDPRSQQLTLKAEVEFVLRGKSSTEAGPEPPAPSGRSRAQPREAESREVEGSEIEGASLREAPTPSPNGRGPVPPAVGGEEPLTRVHAGNLRFRADDSTIYLGGPVQLTRGNQKVQAGDSEIVLDDQRRARQVRLEGGILGTDQSAGGSSQVRARRGFLELTEGGKLQSLRLEEDAGWVSSFEGAQREGRAQRVELSFHESDGFLDRIAATGDVQLLLRQSRASAPPPPRPSGSRAPVIGAGTQILSSPRADLTMGPGGQSLRKILTQAPSVLELKPARTGEEQWNVRGGEFRMDFDAEGNLTEFAAERDVRFVTELPEQPSRRRISTSDHLAATFDARTHSVARIEQWGHYRYQDSEKQGRAERAEYAADGERIILQDQAALWDSTGKLSAAKIVFQNATGSLEAAGNLSTTYFPKPSPGADRSEPIHVVADRLFYDASTGKAQYQDHVRLWQGMNLLEAGRMELDRPRQQLEAREEVYSVFPQPPTAPGTGLAPVSARNEKTDRTEGTEGTEPVEIRSDRLLYKQQQRSGVYSGAVRLRNASTTVTAGEIEVFLQPAGTGKAAANSGGVERTVARNNVRILDSGRTGNGEWAEYLPAEGTIRLAGNPAVVSDPQRGSTQGARLTYRTGDDRISVEGEPGLPAETRRQVQR